MIELIQFTQDKYSYLTSLPFFTTKSAEFCSRDSITRPNFLFQKTNKTLTAEW